MLRVLNRPIKPVYVGSVDGCDFRDPITAAANTTGEIILLPETFVMTAGLTLLANAKLFGSRESILDMDGTFVGITLDDGAQVDGLTIDATGLTGYTINATGKARCMVSQVYLAGGNGIRLDGGCYQCKIIDTIHDVGSYGVILDGSFQNIVRGNQMNLLTAVGVYVTGVNGYSNVIDSNAIVHPASDGMFIAGDGNIISNNQIAEAGGNGIQANDCEHAKIVGNAIETAGSHGVFITGDTYHDKHIISSNSLKNNGQTLTDSFADIYLDDSLYCSIIGNIMDATLTNKVAANITNSPSSNYLLVCNNIAMHGSIARISLNGANNVATNNIEAA